MSEMKEEEEETKNSRRRKVCEFNKSTGGPQDSMREEDRSKVVGWELEEQCSSRTSTLFSFEFHEGESEDAVYYVALVQGGQQEGRRSGLSQHGCAFMDAQSRRHRQQ